MLLSQIKGIIALKISSIIISYCDTISHSLSFFSFNKEQRKQQQVPLGSLSTVAQKDPPQLLSNSPVSIGWTSISVKSVTRNLIYEDTKLWWH